MTEYEYADLFASFLSAQNVLFANYMAIVFGMLTVSWFVAKRLSGIMMVMLLFIYSVWSINIIISLNAVFSDFSRLALKINKMGQKTDTALDWLGPVASGDNVGYLNTLPTQVMTLCILVYLASIIFFFAARRKKSETLSNG